MYKPELKTLGKLASLPQRLALFTGTTVRAYALLRKNAAEQDL